MGVVSIYYKLWFIKAKWKVGFHLETINKKSDITTITFFTVDIFRVVFQRSNRDGGVEGGVAVRQSSGCCSGSPSIMMSLTYGFGFSIFMCQLIKVVADLLTFVSPQLLKWVLYCKWYHVCCHCIVWHVWRNSHYNNYFIVYCEWYCVCVCVCVRVRVRVRVCLFYCVTCICEETPTILIYFILCRLSPLHCIALHCIALCALYCKHCEYILCNVYG